MTASNTTSHHPPGGRFTPAALVTLGLLAAVAPFATDLYLPAFPTMTHELHTSTTGVQFSLTAFLVGAGLGQLVFGPWSDRAGRYRPLLVGLGVYLVASVVAALAPTIGVLVVARLAQGMAGAAGMVIGRAMVLDRATGTAAAKAMNLMMLIGGVAPVVAPLAGSLLSDVIGWRGLLAIVAALGAISLAATLAFLRESLPRERRDAMRAAATGGGLRGILQRRYIGFTVAFTFGMAIMMAYISASPFVYQQMIGLTTIEYGIAFAVNALGLAVFSAASSRLGQRFELRNLTLIGLIVSALASATVLGLSLADVAPVALMVPMFLAVASLGLVFGNATVLALAEVPRHSVGSASAVLGAVQFALAGIVAAIVGLGGEETSVPLGVTMVVVAVIAILGLLIGYRTADTTEEDVTGGDATGRTVETLRPVSADA